MTEENLIWPPDMPRPLSNGSVPGDQVEVFIDGVELGKRHYQRGVADPNPQEPCNTFRLSGYLLGFYNPQATISSLFNLYDQRRQNWEEPEANWYDPFNGDREAFYNDRAQRMP